MTRSPARTPSPAYARASRLARRSSSPRVRDSPSHRTATRDGLRALRAPRSPARSLPAKGSGPTVRETPRGAPGCRETIRLVIIFGGAAPRSPAAPEASSLDKRTTAAEAVAELRDGMTIGIGGWGSRRKPMALVREILRSPREGPDGRDLRRARRRAALQGRQGARASSTASCRSTRSRSSPTSGKARQAGAFEARGARRGHAAVGPATRRRYRLPFLPTRAGLGSDVMAHQPGPAGSCARPTTTARSWSRCRRSSSTSRSST